MHIDKRAETVAKSLSAYDPDKLISTREAAKLLGTSESYLHKGRSQGYGPPVIKMGPTLCRYRVSALIEWLESRTIHFEGEKSN